jgi:hypothetical protein
MKTEVQKVNVKYDTLLNGGLDGKISGATKEMDKDIKKYY